ncbi:hypothetical protein [Flavobacterium sp. JP2137]|uniref:hypothetical protein n=1 Tax=Flavobacterium sp. JP2137 TaxID=3414510 RepID=UPI003D2FC6FA
MKNKNAISRLLLITALLFTVVFQFVHSLSHFSSEIATASHRETRELVSKHSDHSHQLSQADHELEKCFACDFFLSPFLQSEDLVFQVLDNTYFHSLKTAVAVPYYHYTSIYFSLRAPPALF